MRSGSPDVDHKQMKQRDSKVLHALRDVDHLVDNVESGDVLGDRVLDLQARVHLQKVEVLTRVDEKLDGA